MWGEVSVQRSEYKMAVKGEVPIYPAEAWLLLPSYQNNNGIQNEYNHNTFPLIYCLFDL